MKKIINGFNNVLFDDSSEYKFDQLHETKFLSEVFTSLSQLMKDEFNDYLFFILSSHDRNIIPSSAKFKTEKQKIIIVLSDESGTVPEYLSPHYYAIFKAYMQPDKILDNNIFNFSLGCVKSVPELPITPINDRDYSVFFIGNLNNSRIKFYFSLISTIIPCNWSFLNNLSRIKKLILPIKSKFDNRFPNSYIRFTNGFMHGITPIEYGQIIANSKIVLCPKGFVSSECFRHYEAMRAGCVIISEKLPETHFYQGSPIIQVNSWKEGLKRATYLLNNPKELEKLNKLTRDWWNERCSEVATAQYMQSCIYQLQAVKC
ncbi:hypothetical protein [Arenibacter certesii]|uniref:Exostosin GT47 domain-containing protein n=1 Tax=Arenibacter certesii TaxID=228955 RepID=A0A918J941_9FLAO|nr:hypothetical protein [Arenibacter certesii]GGW50560.1 hypothetical protein GCM10007383_37960 [Arenibacter certesii]